MLKRLACEIRKPCRSQSCNFSPGCRRHTHVQIGDLQLAGSKVHWYLNTREDMCTSARNRTTLRTTTNHIRGTGMMKIKIQNMGTYFNTQRRTHIGKFIFYTGLILDWIWINKIHAEE
jgi:hypothetical protein